MMTADKPVLYPVVCLGVMACCGFPIAGQQARNVREMEVQQSRYELRAGEAVQLSAPQETLDFLTRAKSRRGGLPVEDGRRRAGRLHPGRGLDRAARGDPGGHRLRGRAELGRIGVFDSAEIARRFDDGHLHAETDPKVRHTPLAREPSSRATPQLFIVGAAIFGTFWCDIDST